MVNSLRKLIFFAPIWPLYMEEKFAPPLEKILGAPLDGSKELCYLTSRLAQG